MDRVNVERHAQRQASVKPFELFDLISGTSTGGYVFWIQGHRNLPPMPTPIVWSLLCLVVSKRTSMSVLRHIQPYSRTFSREQSTLFRSTSGGMCKDDSIPKYWWSQLERLSKTGSFLQRSSPILRKIETAECKTLDDRYLSKLIAGSFVCATTYENTITVHLRDYTLLDESNHDQVTIVDAALLPLQHLPQLPSLNQQSSAFENM